MARAFIAAVALLTAAVLLWQWTGSRTSAHATNTAVVKLLSGGETAGYAQALRPRTFTFPADFGPHNDFRQEWWYYTGNLDTADGRHFGYELTFFRFALAPSAPQRSSAWATRQIYLAHFAITDVQAQKYHQNERLDRAAVGLAGAHSSPYRVWAEDWSAAGGSRRGLPMHLQAAGADVALDLQLDSLKPVVLQGDRGLSQKGSQPGNASYYYSLTRLASRGSVRIAGLTYAVTGLSWMDREWSTSALEAGQIGWDWFALQLSDGRELMYYRLRRKDGGPDPHSQGVIVDQHGGWQTLSPDQIKITVRDHWHSAQSGAIYPAAWTLDVPGQGLWLQVTPYLADQEWSDRLRYWEGAVRLEDRNHRPMGSGYVELVGYAPP